VGGLFEVHNELGPGFIHRIYASASFHELKLRGLEVKPCKSMQVYYKGVSVGEVRLAHLLVGADVMVFPVATQEINDIRFNSLKAWMKQEGVNLGILANFYATEIKPVFLRV
jgi:GxxExxY protein